MPSFQNEGINDSTEIHFMPSFQNEGTIDSTEIQFMPSFWKEGINWISVLSIVPSFRLNQFMPMGINWQYWNPIYALFLRRKLLCEGAWLGDFIPGFLTLRFAQEYKNV